MQQQRYPRGPAVHREAPKEIPDWELEPKQANDRGFASRPQPLDNGFNARIAALTEAERIAIDRARNAIKGTPGYFADSNHFDLCEQVQRERRL